MTEDVDSKTQRLLSQVEIAEFLGITPRQVRNLVRAGMPVAEGADTARPKYDADVVNQWYAERTALRMPRADSCKAESVDSSSAGDEPESYREARARQARADADLSELRVARLRAPIEKLERDVAELGESRKLLMTTLRYGFPESLAAKIAAVACEAFGWPKEACDADFIRSIRAVVKDELSYVQMFAFGAPNKSAWNIEARQEIARRALKVLDEIARPRLLEIAENTDEDDDDD